MTQAARFARCVADGVLQIERRWRNQLVAEDVHVAVATRVEVLAERQPRCDVRAEVVVERRRQIVINLEIIDVVPCDGTVRLTRGRQRQRLITGVVVVVGPEGIVEAEPARGDIVETDIADEATELAPISVVREDEKGVVVAAGPSQARRCRIRKAIGAMQTGGRVQIGQIVEVRWRTQRAEEQSGGVRALLHVLAACVDVIEVPA